MMKKSMIPHWEATRRSTLAIVRALILDVLGHVDRLYIDWGIKAAFHGPLFVQVGIPSFHYTFAYGSLDGPEPPAIKEALDAMEVLKCHQRAILFQLKIVLDSPVRSVIAGAQRLHTTRRACFLKAIKDLVQNMKGKKQLIDKAAKVGTAMRKTSTKAERHGMVEQFVKKALGDNVWNCQSGIKIALTF